MVRNMQIVLLMINMQLEADHEERLAIFFWLDMLIIPSGIIELHAKASKSLATDAHLCIVVLA